MFISSKAPSEGGEGALAIKRSSRSGGGGGGGRGLLLRRERGKKGHPSEVRGERAQFLGRSLYRGSLVFVRGTSRRWEKKTAKACRIVPRIL